MNFNNFKKQFLEKSKDFVQNYDIDQANEAAVKVILSYFAGIDSKAAPLNKGLLVKGCVGSGKTMTFKIIQQVIKGFVINNIREVVADFNLGGFESLQLYMEKIRLFDDIGSEHDGKFYALNTNVVQELIVRRYEKFQNKGLITHFTTNEGSQQLNVRYGDRAYDRLREMCTIIILGDNNLSRRDKYNPVEKLKPKEIEVDKEQLNKEAIKEFIRLLYEGETVIDNIYEIVYDWLRENEILILSNDRKAEITKEAEEMKYIINEKDITRNIATGRTYRAKELIKNPAIKLITLQKKIAVLDYFKTAKEMDVTFDEILK
jgi:DNA replication protein DnaC